MWFHKLLLLGFPIPINVNLRKYVASNGSEAGQNSNSSNSASLLLTYNFTENYYQNETIEAVVTSTRSGLTMKIYSQSIYGTVIDNLEYGDQYVAVLRVTSYSICNDSHVPTFGNPSQPSNLQETSKLIQGQTVVRLDYLVGCEY